MSTYPTKASYENALKVVKEYEDRQKDLQKLNKDLGFHLKQFQSVKFDVNKKDKEITFTGLTNDGKLKLTKSKAQSGDVFEEVIGKLICVLQALGQDIEYVDKYVEKSGFSFDIGTISADKFVLRNIEPKKWRYTNPPTLI